MTTINSFLQYLNGIDPSPFFVLSLIPYLFFLHWAKKGNQIPAISLLGFRLTLLFVAMTIIFAIYAKLTFDSSLTDVDPLHGAAEAFLTVSDAFVAAGVIRLYQSKVVKNS